MRIQHNIPAMSAYRNYNNNTSALAKNLEKLSSGYKINRAGDDAAGLAISEKMRAQITGLNAAQKNVKDGISLVKTAEGAMQEIQDMLNRMDYLATQSANGTYDNEVDRLNLQKEVDALKTEINRIADSANFNGIKLLDGTQAKGTSIRGATSLNESMLPPTSTGLPGTGTVLNKEAANNSQGTTFSVDLHNYSLSNGSAAGEYTLTAGDVEITFKGAASGAGSTVTADKLIDALAKGDTTNFTVTGVTVGGSVASISASGVIKGTKYGDIQLTASTEGDNRLTFTQVNPPKTEAEVWDVAKSVSIAGGAGRAATPHTLSSDPVVYTAPTYDVAAVTGPIEIVGGSASQAISAQVSLDSALADEFVTAGATAGGNITLSYGSNQWTFTMGTKTVDATASLSGSTVTFKAGSKTVATLTLTAGSQASAATMGAIQTAFGTTGKQVGELVKNDGSQETPKPDMPASIAKGSGAVSFLTSQGGYSVVGTPTTAESEVEAIASGVSWAASTGALTASQASAIRAMTITVGSITVKGSAIQGIASGASMGAVRSAVINALEKAAAEHAKTQYAASASTITVYSNFRFVDKNTGAVVHAADQNAKIAYDVTTLSNKATPPAGGAGQDYNFTTTAIDKVGTDAGDRLAGTYLTTDQVSKYVADGKGMKIGTEQYIFSTDKNLSVPQGTKVVDISDLVDADGKLDADGLKTALERLTKAAADNATYTVGFDGDRLGFEEKQTQTTFVDENGKSTLNTRENIAKSLGFIEGSVKGTGGLTLQIGDTSDDFNQLSVVIGDMHTTGMGIDGVDISSQAGAQAAIDQIKSAINYVSGIRGDLGAVQNRLEHTSNNLSVMAENIQDAESTIRDTDVAEEMMSYVKNNILVQSAQAMLAQANQVPQGVLQLLG